MRPISSKFIILTLSICLWALHVHALDTLLDKADAAVNAILFEYKGAPEFAVYVVNESGFVDISFARNIPDPLYGEILTKLQKHPDIKGVLSGKGGPACKLF